MDQSYHAWPFFFSGAFMLVWLVALALGLYLNWRVAQKSGYPGAYSLLMLIPLVNIIVYFIWVFSEWPVEIEARRARGGEPIMPR